MTGVDDLERRYTNFVRPFSLDIEERLGARAAAEHRSVHKTVELAIEKYIQWGDHQAEVLHHFRTVIARHRDFYDELGDR